MKILWLSHLVPYPPKGGVLLRAYHLVKELAVHHEMDVLAFNQRSLIEPYFENYEQGLEESIGVVSGYCDRVKVIDCPTDRYPLWNYAVAAYSLFSKHPYNINWLRDREYARVLQQWRSEKQYDLIHCDTISLAPYIDSVDDCLLSLDHHNIESHMLHRRAEQETNGLKSWYYRQEGVRLQKEEEHYCPRFNINITCSDLDTDRLKAISPASHVVTIPNGVDVEEFTPAETSAAGKKLLFIGSMNWYPNVNAMRLFAESIWPLLKAADPEITMDLVGVNPPEFLRALASKDKAFHVHGFVDDIGSILDEAAVFVCPIYDSGGTKLKMLDAFASGKAVVAYSVSCEGIGVTDGEDVIIADDPQAFCDAVIRLINDEALRRKLEGNARTLAVQKYGFANIGANLAKLFGSLERKPKQTAAE